MWFTLFKALYFLTLAAWLALTQRFLQDSSLSKNTNSLSSPIQCLFCITTAVFFVLNVIFQITIAGLTRDCDNRMRLREDPDYRDREGPCDGPTLSSLIVNIFVGAFVGVGFTEKSVINLPQICGATMAGVCITGLFSLRKNCAEARERRSEQQAPLLG